MKRVGIVVLIGLAILAGYQRYSITQLQEQSRLLTQEQRDTKKNAEEVERADVSAQKQLESWRKENGDIHRLRNEVSRLREQALKAKALAAKATTTAKAAQTGGAVVNPVSEQGQVLAKESWTNVGFDSPEAALQTFMWTYREGDLQQGLDCMSPELKEKQSAKFGDDVSMDALKKEASQFASYAINNQTFVTDNGSVTAVEFDIQLNKQNESTDKHRIRFKQFQTPKGDQWKIDNLDVKDQ